MGNVWMNLGNGLMWIWYLLAFTFGLIGLAMTMKKVEGSDHPFAVANLTEVRTSKTYKLIGLTTIGGKKEDIDIRPLFWSVKGQRLSNQVRGELAAITFNGSVFILETVDDLHCRFDVYDGMGRHQASEEGPYRLHDNDRIRMQILVEQESDVLEFVFRTGTLMQQGGQKTMGKQKTKQEKNGR